jgi:hypothetical protein
MLLFFFEVDGGNPHLLLHYIESSLGSSSSYKQIGEIQGYKGEKTEKNTEKNLLETGNTKEGGG